MHSDAAAAIEQELAAAAQKAAAKDEQAAGQAVAGADVAAGGTNADETAVSPGGAGSAASGDVSGPESNPASTTATAEQPSNEQAAGQAVAGADVAAGGTNADETAVSPGGAGSAASGDVSGQGADPAAAATTGPGTNEQAAGQAVAGADVAAGGTNANEAKENDAASNDGAGDGGSSVPAQGESPAAKLPSGGQLPALNPNEDAPNPNAGTGIQSVRPVFGRAARIAAVDVRDAGRAVMPKIVAEATHQVLKGEIDRLLAAYRKSDEREQIIQKQGSDAFENGLPSSMADKLLTYAITAGLDEAQAELLVQSWGFDSSAPGNRPSA